ncbi:hypothetical protein [Jannaschia sp. R86511]|uniref:hypothetical protein n=1 Tax=Jannaschia sp. R86511 TaxID=3093853 RepID=UPI0036D2DB5E
MSVAPPHPQTPDPYLPGGWGAPPAARPPVDGWAVTALVTALLGLVPVGLVTAVAGLVRTSGGRRRGRGLAVAGLLVSLLAGGLQAAAVALLLPVWPDVRDGFADGFRDGFADAPDTDGASTGTSGAADPTPSAGTTEEEVPAEELTVGTCFVDPETDVFYDVGTVPCDVPHDGEVIALVELEDRTWPGDDPVLDEGYDACLVEITDRLLAAGVDRDDLDPWVFTPTRESWVLFGDRQGTCVVYDLDGDALTAPVLP